MDGDNAKMVANPLMAWIIREALPKLNSKAESGKAQLAEAETALKGYQCHRDDVAHKVRSIEVAVLQLAQTAYALGASVDLVNGALGIDPASIKAVHPATEVPY